MAPSYPQQSFHKKIPTKLANNKARIVNSKREGDRTVSGMRMRSENTSGLLTFLPVYKKNPIIITVFESNSIFSMADYLNCDYKFNYGCTLRNSIVSNKL